MSLSGKMSNSSASNYCELQNCFIDTSLADFTLTCTVTWIVVGGGEVITGVHLHWKEVPTATGVIAAGKFEFPRIGASSAVAENARLPSNLTQAISNNPTFDGDVFFINLHSNLNRDGAMAGVLDIEYSYLGAWVYVLIVLALLTAALVIVLTLWYFKQRAKSSPDEMSYERVN